VGPVPPADIRRRRPLPGRRVHPHRSRMTLFRRLRQDPGAIRHWLLVGLLAWLLAALVSHALGRADQARERWGRTTVVWVADRALGAGDDLDGALRPARWPAALVPAAAVTDPPADARAAAAVDAGTAITSAMVERAGAERRTVAVPLPDAHLPVENGDRVDVWATTDPAVTGDGVASTRRVASGARVTGSSRGSAVLEVAPAQVAAITEAAASATIALVGVP